MADITVTFEDGQPHMYSGVPDNVTPEQIEQRANKDFSGRKVTHIDRSNVAPKENEWDNNKPSPGLERSRFEAPKTLFPGTNDPFDALSTKAHEAGSQLSEFASSKGASPEISGAIGAFVPTVAEAIPLLMGGGGVKAVETGAKAALKGAAEIPGKIIPVTNEEKAVLAKKAMDKDITIPLHALSNNKYVKLAGEFLDNLPLSGSSIEKNKTAFHKGIIEQIGGDTSKDVLTPSVFGKALDEQGKKIGDIYQKTTVPMDSVFSKDLQSVVKDHDVMVGENLEQLNKYVEKIGELADKHSGKIPGIDLRHLNTQLGETLRGLKPGDLKNALSDLKGSISDAVARSLPDDAARAELQDANKKYAKAMTILPLVSKGGLSGFTPSALKSQLINNASGKRRMATDSAGELGDFANLAQEFMKEQGSSMTTERHLATGALVGGLVGVGRAATGLVIGNVYNRLGPKLSHAIVNKTLKPLELKIAEEAKRASELADIQAQKNAAEAARLAPRVLNPGEEGAYPIKTTISEPPKTRGLLSIDEESKTPLSGKSKHLTSDQDHIEFPLRQEVLQYPEHADAINAYVRKATAWKDKIAKAIDYDKIAEYQSQLDKISKSFGDHMAKFGIDSAEDATGLRRPLYEGGKRPTKLPIKKVSDYSTISKTE